MYSDDTHDTGGHAEERAGQEDTEAEAALQGHLQLPDDQYWKQYEGQIGQGEDSYKLNSQSIIPFFPPNFVQETFGQTGGEQDIGILLTS